MSVRLLTSLPRRLRLPRRPRRPRPPRRPPRQHLRLRPRLLRLPSQFRVPGGGRNSSRIKACPLFTFGLLGNSAVVVSKRRCAPLLRCYTAVPLHRVPHLTLPTGRCLRYKA